MYFTYFFSLLLSHIVSKLLIFLHSFYFTALCCFKPCPHCRRKVRLSHKSETVAEFRDQSPFSATVSLFCDSVDRALRVINMVMIVHVCDVTLLCSYYSNVGDDQQCWIGLHKSEPEASDNSSYWLDGNPSTYRNWDDEPHTAGHKCVRIVKNGKFRFVPCNWPLRYVCKGIYFSYKLF